MKSVLCFCGSLRAASSSRAVTAALRERLKDRVETATFDISRLPHYNADITDDPVVAELKAAIAAADGLIFVSPEYNYSIPGVLKNAIDWASRPGYQSVFVGKPCFIVSTSGGALGGVRLQSQLKYMLTGMLAIVPPCREVIIPHANTKTRDGVFDDEAILDFALNEMGAFLAAL